MELYILNLIYKISYTHVIMHKIVIKKKKNALNNFLYFYLKDYLFFYTS